MIDTSLSYFDAIVVGILGLSCLFAFFRGFVKEILSLGAWIGAGIITIYYFPDVARVLEPRFKNPTAAAGVATLSIYIIALLCFSLLNALILRYIREGSDVGFLDNSLGLMFGAFRGAFVVSLGYFLLTMTMSEEEYPTWIKEAHSRPLVEQGAVVLGRAAPQYLREISSLHEKIEAHAGKTGATEKKGKSIAGRDKEPSSSETELQHSKDDRVYVPLPREESPAR